MEIKEIKSIKEMQAWMKIFRKGYSGGARKVKNEYLTEKDSRMFVAVENGIEIGYVRINNKSYLGIQYEGVWSISDGYVMKSFRSNGVFRNLIEYVLENFNVQMINIELERVKKNYDYYSSLGFTNFRIIDDFELVNLYSNAFVKQNSNLHFHPVHDPRIVTQKLNASSALQFEIIHSLFPVKSDRNIHSRFQSF